MLTRILWTFVLVTAIAATCHAETSEKPISFPQTKKEQHPIDIFLTQCIEEHPADHGMRTCANEAEDKWNKELSKTYQTLLKTLNKPSQSALKASQSAWEKYKDREFKFMRHFYDAVFKITGGGSMYLTMYKFDQLNTLVERAYYLLSVSHFITSGTLTEFIGENEEEIKKHPLDASEDACLKDNASLDGKIQCYKQSEKAWDNELNKTYQKLNRKLNAKPKKSLKTTQTTWLKFRDSQLKFVKELCKDKNVRARQFFCAYVNKEIIRQRALVIDGYLNTIEVTVEGKF